MQSQDDVRQLVVIMGKVKKIEGEQRENTERNKSDVDNGSDGNKTDEQKIDNIVNKKDSKILSLEQDEVKVVDEDMNETDRKEMKDNTMGLRIGNDETEMVDEENNDRGSKNTKENKNNAPYTSFKKVIFEVIGIKLLFQILFVNHLA